MLAIACVMQVASAQDAPISSQQELDQVLAPIALYPDTLLSQILMAATYPLDVADAERWRLANPRFQGMDAVQAVQSTNWDPSVQSLLAFPQILSMMGRNPHWTERLGDAFLAQPEQVMDTVQALRRRAYAAGNLRSNDYARVQSQDGSILIDQADSGMGYEPYYDSRVVYGNWWWPAYPPVFWNPWPGYTVRAGFGTGFLWGAGIVLGADFFFGGFDWNQHRVQVNNSNRNLWRGVPHATAGTARVWQHVSENRRGIPYRSPALQGRYPQAGAPKPPDRAAFRGRVEPASGLEAGSQSVPGPAGGRVRPGTATADRPHALEGIGRAADVRQSSERGRARLQAPPREAPRAAAPRVQSPAPRPPAPAQTQRQSARPAAQGRQEQGAGPAARRERPGRQRKEQ